MYRTSETNANYNTHAHTHTIIPSWEHILCVKTHVFVSYPRCGPPFMMSNTWAGFNSCLNRRRNFTPWLSPLLLFTKTNSGLVQVGGHDAFQNPADRITLMFKYQVTSAVFNVQVHQVPSESMLLRAVGGITDTLHWPSGHLRDSCSLHPACTWRTQTQSWMLFGSVVDFSRKNCTHHGFTPQTTPVLKSQNTATGFITHRTFSANRQISLQPLMRHRDLTEDLEIKLDRLKTQKVLKH